MKICLIICSLVLTFKYSSADNKTRDARKVLIKVAGKLNSLKSLQYNYQRTLSYSSENYHSVTAGQLFFDFSVTDTVAGFKYQVNNETWCSIYNGAEQFELDKTGKTIDINNHPTFNTFNSISFFYNSIITLKKALPAIIADDSIEKSVSDTSLNNRAYFLVTLLLNKRVLNNLGGFSTLTGAGKISYRLLVDKNTWLPRQVLQTNSINTDYTQTDFTDIEVNGAYPPELTWYYSTYTKEYKTKVKKEIIPITLHTLAPDWSLPVFGVNDSLTLRQLKGNVVMLEFWIKNCGYCIAAVPELNDMKVHYKDKQLRMIGINVADKEADINFFRQKNKPDYQLVYQGQQVAAQYGVGYYPMIVLIDQQNSVVYAGSFDKTKITGLLNQLLYP